MFLFCFLLGVGPFASKLQATIHCIFPLSQIISLSRPRDTVEHCGSFRFFCTILFQVIARCPLPRFPSSAILVQVRYT